MRKTTVAEDLKGIPEEEQQTFLEGRLALFRADVVGSQAHERYALLVAGFSGAVLTSLVGKSALSDLRLGWWLGGAALLNAVSLLLAAANLMLAHLIAQTRAGLDPAADPASLAKILSSLPPERRMDLLKRLLGELAETRFIPDRWFINGAIEGEGAALADGVFNHLRRLQRFIQWQGLLFRLQLITAVAGGLLTAAAVGLR